VSNIATHLEFRRGNGAPQNHTGAFHYYLRRIKRALQPLQAIKVSNIATTIARFISDLLIPP
jgi:hypothetical protein